MGRKKNIRIGGGALIADGIQFLIALAGIPQPALNFHTKMFGSNQLLLQVYFPACNTRHHGTYGDIQNFGNFLVR